MTNLTRKYVFEQKLNGKPINLFVESGGCWATKEDARLLQKYGILVPLSDDNLIATHKILTYGKPFNPGDASIAEIPKGHLIVRQRPPRP